MYAETKNVHCPRPNLRITIRVMFNRIQLTVPVAKSIPKLSNSVRSLCPLVPNKVTCMWSDVPACDMSPVVTSTLYSAMVTLWKLSKKQKKSLSLEL